ncbi:type VII secretion-associated serine protease mycosin [Dactylosporangium aurantiacum]|nr:type VII secretion-associated serine protease mycosin [Dactylosporangium aurantiacum]MDG6101041.1 type VII secretion-associated serine protease mycosin [Dactylosporangium aurantiacum]
MYDHRKLTPLADGRGVTVAVIDSGVDARHPQLQGVVRAGPDQLDGGGSLVDCVGHGTGVAGIIAARPVPGSPLHGLAPGATILALRVSELVELEDGTTAGRRGTPAGVAAAIRAAVERGAGVINLSLVSYQDSADVREAVRFAVAHDVVLVAAAGNRFAEGNRTPFPAAYEGVIGVGAVGPDGQRLPGSQTGPYVDLVAPGGRIVTTATPQGLTTVEGTSFAAPYVAAAAALLRQYRPEMTAAQVAARLAATADGGAAGPGFGAGVLNPYRALTEETGGQPQRTGQALAPLAGDPQAAAKGAAEDRTLLLAAAGVGLAALMLLIAVVVPRGRRRGWRPGLRRLPTPRAPEDRTAAAFDRRR